VVQRAEEHSLLN